MCQVQDSNLRGRTPTDLQTADAHAMTWAFGAPPVNLGTDSPRSSPASVTDLLVMHVILVHTSTRIPQLRNPGKRREVVIGEHDFRGLLEHLRAA